MDILIIRFSSLGDLVTLEPTFRAIRTFYNNAKITFLTSQIGKELYEDTNFFDNYIVMRSRKQLLNIAFNLRKKDFDIVFDLHCNSPSHFIKFFLKSKKTICVSKNLIQKIFNLQSEVKTLEEMLILSGIDEFKVKKFLSVSDILKVNLSYKDNITIKKIINDKFKNKKIITIGIGASKKWQSKKWGLDNYKKLIEMLHKDYGIILIGSKLEETDGKIIEKNFPNILNFINKTDIQTLKSILGNSNLYIGNDSGPTQIAAGIGIPTIAIFGPTAKEHLSSKNYNNIYHLTPSKKINCHPCYNPICPYNHECMKDITVDKVLKKIKEIL